MIAVSRIPTLLLAAWCLLLVPPAFAQCQSGIPAEGNPQCLPPEVLYGDRDPTADQAAKPARRWSALAIGVAPAGGVIGRSDVARNKREASRQAIADCRRQGGGDCKPFAYSEACAAVAWAKDRYAVEGGADPRKAADAAMAACVRISGEDCVVFHTSCAGTKDSTRAP